MFSGLGQYSTVRQGGRPGGRVEDRPGGRVEDRPGGKVEDRPGGRVEGRPGGRPVLQTACNQLTTNN